MNIRKVRGKDAIRVHCNSRVDIVDKDDDPPGYRTVWYELTGIANILSMSRSTKKFRVVFEIECGNCSSMVLLDREVRFQLSTNGLYYFGSVDRENSVLLINTLSENQEGFTRREYKGAQ